MQQNDSIDFSAAQAAQGTATVRQPHQLTPHEVLKWLPKDATPAQMDSAIQRHIKPAPIHWSSRPDTLHLPGHTKGKSYRDITLPKYYKESFFSDKPMFHPELSGGRPGVAGDPVPYTIANDNFFICLLLGCFILATVAFSKSRRFIARQAKNFFYVQRGNASNISETSNEVRFQIFLVLQTCLLLALSTFFYTRTYIGEIFVLEPYQIIGIYTGVLAVYFLVKIALYSFTSWVFFDRRRNAQWIHAYIFLISSIGVVLFPMVILQTYFELTMYSALVYTAVIIIIAKILSLFKTYIIFFKENGGILQIILYFCALEIVPLLALWGVLVIINGQLKINF